MDDKALVEALIKKSLLLAETGQKLLTESAQMRQSVEDLIYGRRLLNEIDVAKVKSELLGIPYKAVEFDKIPDDVLKLIPEETAQTYHVVPLSRDEKLLVVGMINPNDVRAQEALRFIAKQNRLSLGVYIITPSDLELVLQRYRPYQSEVQSALTSMNIKPGKGADDVRRIVQIEEGASTSEDAPIIKIVAST